MKYLKFGITSILVFFLIVGGSVRNHKSAASFQKIFSSISHNLEIIPSANASSGLQNLADAIRMMFFLVVGFPDDATYNTLTGGGANGPPEEGLIQMTADIAKHIYDAAGVTSCSALPTSGTVSVTDQSSGNTFVATFAKPSDTVPTGYTGADNVYGESFSVSLNGTKIARISFNCPTATMPADGTVYFYFPDSKGTRKIALTYQVAVDASGNYTPKADFAMYYVPTAESMILRISASSGKINLNMVRAAPADSGSGYQGFRMAVSGDTVAQDATVYFESVSASSMAAVAALSPDSTTTDLTGTASLSNGTNAFLFCMQAGGTNPVSGACSGLALSAPSAPLFSAQDWNIADVAATSFNTNFPAP